jgi:hypothetical protein
MEEVVVDHENQITQLRQKKKHLIACYMDNIPINFSRDAVPMLQNARLVTSKASGITSKVPLDQELYSV